MVECLVCIKYKRCIRIYISLCIKYKFFKESLFCVGFFVYNKREGRRKEKEKDCMKLNLYFLI